MLQVAHLSTRTRGDSLGTKGQSSIDAVDMGAYLCAARTDLSLEDADSRRLPGFAQKNKNLLVVFLVSTWILTRFILHFVFVMTVIVCFLCDVYEH